MPVSICPETQKPDPVLLKMSFTENLNGLSTGRSGHLKLSITSTSVGPVYLKNGSLNIFF